MAILVNGQQQEQDQDTVNQQGPISVSGTPTSTIASGSAMGTAGAAPARKASGSGRFTNIQSYLQASQGSGEKIAGRIGQKVGQQTEKLGQAVETAKAVNPQLDAEKQRIAQASGFAQQLQQDPTKLVQDPNQVSAFAQLRTGQTGLQPIQQQAQQSFDTAQSELGRVQQLAGMTGSEAGRFELLRQSLGRPSYTRGQQKLDQLLVQSSGGDVLGQLQRQTSEKAKAGEQLLGTTKGDIEARLAGLGTEAGEAQKLLTGTLGGWDDPTTPENEATGVLGGLQTDLMTRAGQKQGQLEDMYTRARAGLESGEIDRDVAEMLGLTNITVGAPGARPGVDFATSKLGSGQQILLGDISSEDLLSRLQKGFSTVTPSGVASEDDYNRLQALKQLSGQTGPTPIELDKAQLGQAGVAAQLNAEQLQKDIQSRLGTLQSQYESTSVDPLAAQKLMAGIASRSLGQLTGMSDLEILQKFNPGMAAQYGKPGTNPAAMLNEAKKIRSDLVSKQNQLATMESSQARTNVGGLGDANLGLTYGQLTTGSGMTGALQNYLNALFPAQGRAYGTPGELAAQLIPMTSDDKIRELMGQGFGSEMQRRINQKYTDLGLGRTLKIK